MGTAKYIDLIIPRGSGQLVKSIKDFPEMLDLRPIVVDDNLVVLGGNMRLKACMEAGLSEVPIIKASNLSEEQKKQFIIKDNVGFGEWDWDIIANEWDTEYLENWGLDIIGFDLDQGDLGETFSLPSGDKEPFTQITFTLADEQADIINKKLDQIKSSEDFKYCETFGNQNSNGNALYLALCNG